MKTTPKLSVITVLAAICTTGLVTGTDAHSPDGAPPALDPSPAVIKAAAPVGGTAAATLSLGNSGAAELQWNLLGAAPDSHFPSSSSPLSLPPRPGSTEVPAFALNNTGMGPHTYIFENALEPAGMVTVGAAPEGTWVSGTFIGDDFSRHYMLESHWQSPTHALIALDTETAAVTPVTTFPIPLGQWGGIAWDATTDTLFGAACVEGACNLYTLDIEAGTSTLVGPITGAADPGGQTSILDLTIDSAGRLYSVNFFTRSLFAIDKTTGAAETIGPLQVEQTPMFLQSLAFDRSTDVLYWFAFVSLGGPMMEGRVYTIDTETGEATPIALIPGPAEQYAADIATIGPCASASTTPWLGYSQASGSTEGGSTTDVALTFDAAGLEPGTYATSACIYSNDPAAVPRTEVPVVFTVESDVLFTDGFESE